MQDTSEIPRTFFNCLLGLDGDFISFENDTTEMVGYSVYDVVGTNIKEYLPYSFREKFKDLSEPIKRNSEKSNLVLICKKGDLSFWSIHTELETVKTRVVVHLHAIKVPADTSNMAKLFHQNNLFYLMERSSILFHFLIDKDNKFKIIDGNGLKKLKLNPKNLIGESVKTSFIGIYNKLADVRKDKNVSFETHHILNDGDISLKTHLMVNPNFKGEIVGYSNDITEFKENFVALEEVLNQKRRLLYKLFKAKEEVQKDLSQDLHDDIGQNITAIRTLSEVVINAESKDVNYYKDLVKNIRDIASDMYTTSYQLMNKLHPFQIDQLGIVAALNSCITDSGIEFSGIKVDFRHDGEFDFLSDICKITLYRILQESLTNILKHSKADYVNVMLLLEGLEDGNGRRTKDREGANLNSVCIVDLWVVDNGVGINDNVAFGRGISSMIDRVQSINGEISIKNAPYKGVEIHTSLTINDV